jgi:hypothetical protein
MNTRTLKRSLLGAVSAALIFASMPASAHCDGRDGPVIKAAQQALDTNNVNRVLIWVQPSDEAEIKEAFTRVRAVRALNPLAKDFADNYFFETLVRVHRAGEGAPYTGIKPAGLDLGPAIPAGDKALVTGSVEPVVDLLAQRIREGITGQYKEVVARKDFKTGDVAAGQQFVKAYVEYIHSVERVYGAAGSAGHAEKAAGSPAHAEKAAPAHAH